MEQVRQSQMIMLQMKEYKKIMKKDISKGLKLWLWFNFIVNLVGAVKTLYYMPNASVVADYYGYGNDFVTVYILLTVVEIIITVSIAVLGLARKKAALIVMVIASIAGLILNINLCNIIGEFTAENNAKMVISSLIVPFITFIFACGDIYDGIID